MGKRVNVGNHELGGKKNLVTKMDKNGSYDEYPCINCGKIFRSYGLMRSTTHPGPCFVSKERAEEITTHKQKKVVEEGKEIYGLWSTAKAKPICIKCKTRLVKCPKKDHPNSKYWSLKRDDGCDLYVCPKGCLEGEELEEVVVVAKKGKEKKMIEADRKSFLCDQKGCGDPDPCKDCQEEAELNDDPRTLQEFVEDMMSAGRRPLYIVGVAEACRWNKQIPEIKEIIQEFSKKFKKEYHIIEKSTII